MVRLGEEDGDSEAARLKNSQASADFFNGPEHSFERKPVLDEPGAEGFGATSDNQHLSESSDASSEGTKQKPAVATSAFTLPSYIPELLRHYIETSVALIAGPAPFFKGLALEKTMTKPALFLAISACGSALLSFLLGGFQITHVISDALFVVIANVVMSGGAFLLSKGMGSKVSFITVFQVFAFCSCFGLFSALPGVGMLFSAAGLVYCFFGLREILGVTMYQTCTIMVLMFMIQTLLTVAHSLGH